MGLLKDESKKSFSVWTFGYTDVSAATPAPGNASQSIVVGLGNIQGISNVSLRSFQFTAVATDLTTFENSDCTSATRVELVPFKQFVPESISSGTPSFFVPIWGGQQDKVYEPNERSFIVGITPDLTINFYTQFGNLQFSTPIAGNYQVNYYYQLELWVGLTGY